MKIKNFHSAGGSVVRWFGGSVTWRVVNAWQCGGVL